MEGSLWVYGQTRLTDYYAGHLTLRELFNRWMALPRHAPIWDVLEEEAVWDRIEQKHADIEKALAIFKPKEG